MLTIHELNAGYNGRSVVSGMSCTIRAGQAWIVRGPNGSGKSTVLKTITGLLPAIAGRIERSEGLGGMARVGFVPQQARVAESLAMTVREFVDLGTVGSQVKGATRRSVVEETLAKVGLAELITEDLRRLSGGQLRRASIARALVRQPLLMVLDEPMAGLDPEAEAIVLELLRGLRRDTDMAILMVSHDLRHARIMGDHGIVLGGGEAEIETVDDEGTAA